MINGVKFGQSDVRIHFMMNPSPEYKEVMAILKDIAESQKRTDKSLARIAESQKRIDESLARIAEKHEKDTDTLMTETDMLIAETDRHRDETDWQLQENRRLLGNMTCRYGKVIEDEFAKVLRKTKRIGEIKLDEIKVRTGKQFEFDLVALNRRAVVVGEVKFRLTGSDVLHFVNHRLPHFSEDCPEEAGNRRIYGMVGGEIMTNAAKAEAKKRGLFIARLKNKEIIIDYVNAQALQKTS